MYAGSRYIQWKCNESSEDSSNIMENYSVKISEKTVGERNSNKNIKESVVMVGTPVAVMMRYRVVVDTDVLPVETFKAVV